MFHFSKTFFISLVVAALVAGCDIVDEPYLVEIGSVGPEPGEKVRKVLLEDFTGQKCPNCPEAAEIAHNLQDLNPDQIVILTIHAGFWAVPSSSGNFTADYRTSVGDDLNSSFNIEYNPTGMINRTEYDGTRTLTPDKWEGAVNAQLDMPAQAWIVITNEYGTSNRKLICSVESTFLENLDGTYKICAFLTESGIISPQQTEDGIDTTYEHNHVLRASLNGTWGDLVGGDGMAVANNKLTDEFEINLDNAWNAENCNIAAFIYNTESLEVIQAEEGAVVE
jgi:hypothetical protein